MKANTKHQKRLSPSVAVWRKLSSGLFVFCVVSAKIAQGPGIAVMVAASHLRRSGFGGEFNDGEVTSASVSSPVRSESESVTSSSEGFTGSTCSTYDSTPTTRASRTGQGKRGRTQNKASRKLKAAAEADPAVSGLRGTLRSQGDLVLSVLKASDKRWQDRQQCQQQQQEQQQKQRKQQQQRQRELRQHLQPQGQHRLQLLVSSKWQGSPCGQRPLRPGIVEGTCMEDLAPLQSARLVGCLTPGKKPVSPKALSVPMPKFVGGGPGNDTEHAGGTHVASGHSSAAPTTGDFGVPPTTQNYEEELATAILEQLQVRGSVFFATSSPSTSLRYCP
jgi:hypothetical protein